jgi:Rps23 Pro-64 3,4-dihydroxylase Tpa1-like proline 4-hydroxylase
MYIRDALNASLFLIVGTKMDEDQLYPALVTNLEKDFAFEKQLMPAQNDIEIIRQHLINRVKQLMARDYQKFLNSLYQIDVNEKKVREIIHSKNKINIPERLADLIIERQLQRVKTQILYRNSKK